jgi:hypothetical protein
MNKGVGRYQEVIEQVAKMEIQVKGGFFLSACASCAALTSVKLPLPCSFFTRCGGEHHHHRKLADI